jgi:signal transduction histidine kinase
MRAEGIPERTLRSRIALGLLGYTLALTAALILHGFWVNEAVEEAVWHSLLEAELDFLERERAADPDFRWPRTETLQAWSYPVGAQPPSSLPAVIADLPVGVSDEVAIDERQSVVMVREVDGERIVLSLDITEMEQAEYVHTAVVLGSALFSAFVLALIVWWLAGRLLRPVNRLALDVDQLRAESPGQRIALPDESSAEIVTIVNALNGYLERHDGYVDRERGFINSVSHELRTPIAVIAGAADVLDQRIGASPQLRAPLDRIRNAAANVEPLIGLLLALAKEPERLKSAAEAFDLDDLLQDLVDDHAHLTQNKALTLSLDRVEPTRLLAPAAIVHVAIGNLLRNAIENSDHGIVRVRVEPAGVVHVDDPGSGLSAEDIGRLYVERARHADGRGGAGLGLALIGRICDHLGWSLRFESPPAGGTHAILDLRDSIVSGHTE